MDDGKNALSVFMPLMSLEDVVRRRNALVEFVSKAMQKDVDYGVVPGATKPTLLKPGAEKLCTLFGLSPKFVMLNCIERWDGEEPFFYYLYHCELRRGDYVVGEGDGSCNSHETKYRYRSANRICPNCGKETIIKGREEYGGGFVCLTKKGGCGAKFGEDDERITSQPSGRIVNADVADQANTILKMAQKRALIAATLIAVNASEFFTQDIEDMVIEGTATVIEEDVAVSKPDQRPEPKPRANPAIPVNQTQLSNLYKLYKEVHGGGKTTEELEQEIKDYLVAEFKHPAEQLVVSEWAQVMTKLQEEKKTKLRRTAT